MPKPTSSRLRKIQSAQKQARKRHIKSLQAKLAMVRKSIRRANQASNARQAGESKSAVGNTEFDLRKLSGFRCRTFPRKTLARENFLHEWNNFHLRFKTSELWRKAAKKNFQGFNFSFEELQKSYPRLLKRLEKYSDEKESFQEFSKQQVDDYYKMYLFLRRKGIPNYVLLR